MKILAIETSCDETAAAVVEANRLPTTANRTDMECRILSNVVSSQIDIHKKFGGVFPELASRAHAERIIPVVEQALACNKPDLMAVTVGPGLIGSLLIGVNFAKTYAYANNLPIIGVNHLSGHIYSCFAGESKLENRNKKLGIPGNPHLTSHISNLPSFPALILIVSGGHTGLYLMKSHSDIQTLGETLDDAAGEAFDKVAKLLQLDYPGGPAITKAAAKFLNPKLKTKPYTLNAITFPRSMLDRKDYNFSFSGLKTAVLYKVKELTKRYALNAIRSQVAYEFQQTVIDILIGKTVQAAYEFHPKSICLCGGVSANQELRKQFQEKISLIAQSSNYPIIFHCPAMELSTDNAAMIGIAAAYQIANRSDDESELRSKHRSKPTTDYRHIHADANLRL